VGHREQVDQSDLAWKFITELQTQKNATKYTVDGTQIAVRKDVATDPTTWRQTPRRRCSPTWSR